MQVGTLRLTGLNNGFDDPSATLKEQRWELPGPEHYTGKYPYRQQSGEATIRVGCFNTRFPTEKPSASRHLPLQFFEFVVLLL